MRLRTFPKLFSFLIVNILFQNYFGYSYAFFMHLSIFPKYSLGFLLESFYNHHKLENTDIFSLPIHESNRSLHLFKFLFLLQ